MHANMKTQLVICYAALYYMSTTAPHAEAARRTLTDLGLMSIRALKSMMARRKEMAPLELPMKLFLAPPKQKH